MHFFIIDERLVPIDHPDSNYKLLQDCFIDPLARAGRIPAENAHPFILDPTREDHGAARYERVLAEHGFGMTSSSSAPGRTAMWVPCIRTIIPLRTGTTASL